MKMNAMLPKIAALRHLPKSLVLLGLFFAGVSLQGAMHKVEVTDRGEIMADQIRFRPVLLDNKSVFHRLNEGSFQQTDFQRKGGATEMSAELSLPNDTRGTFVQKTKELPGGVLDYKARFEFSPEAKIWGILISPVTMSIRRFAGLELLIDGKPLVLPRKASSRSNQRLFEGNVKSLEIPLRKKGSLVINGDFELLLIDHRPDGVENFSLRVRFSPANGTLSESDLNVTFSIKE